MFGDPELNPFAAELGRAAAVAAAPDKAPSRRELARISGLSKTAVADWLAGKSLPRSWDDGAVLLVDSIIKFAARYGKSFPDEDAVRQRCRDAYYCAKSAQQMNGNPGVDSSILHGGVITDSGARCAADGPLVSVKSAPEAGIVVNSAGGWRAKRTIWTGLVVTILAGTVTLALLWWPGGKAATPLISVKTKKCVSVAGDVDETRAFQRACTSEPGSQWYLQRTAGDDIFRIVNASNGKCLSASDGMHGGAHVVAQRSCADVSDTRQLWSFVKDGEPRQGWTSGTFTNMRSSQLLDINGGSTEEGVPVIQWFEDHGSNQRFQMMTEAVG